MKKKSLILCYCLILTVIANASNDKLLKLIVDDMYLSNQIYKNRSALWPDKPDKLYDFVKLISIDTIRIGGYYRSSYSLRYMKAYNKHMELDPPRPRMEFAYYTLYSVKIAIDVRWYANKNSNLYSSMPDVLSDIQNPLSYDTLNYVVLNDYGNYYKVFGFCVTDIREKIVGKDTFKGFAKLLRKEGILSKKQSKFYLESIINKEHVINWKVGKPCEYFKYQYDMKEEDLQCSIILKPKLLSHPRFVMGIDTD